MPDHWTAADGRLLKDLREDTGLDRASFARRCTLSAAQLAELEDGGHGRFYSERIKAHTGQGLLRKLGHHAPPERLPEPEPALEVMLPPIPGPMPTAIVRSAAEVPSVPQPTDRRRARLLITTGLAVAVAAAIGIALAPGWSGPSRPPAGAVAVAMAAPSAPTQAAAANTEPVPLLPAPSPSAAEPTATSARPVASDAATQAQASPGRCNWPPPADTLAHYTPPTAFRPDNYVYVEAVTPASVCVIDGQNRQTLAQVKPGDGVSVYGEAPFTVQTRQWSDLRVFFQGIRVNLESAVTPQAVVLNAR